jgi:hypothetical protein
VPPRRGVRRQEDESTVAQAGEGADQRVLGGILGGARRAGQFPAWFDQSRASCFAAATTASNIAAVSLPVCVFCWLTW